MRIDLAEAFRLFLTDLGYDSRAKDDLQGKEDDLQRTSDFLFGHLRRGDLPAVAHEYSEEHIDERGAHFLVRSDNKALQPEFWKFARPCWKSSNAKRDAKPSEQLPAALALGISVWKADLETVRNEFWSLRSRVAKEETINPGPESIVSAPKAKHRPRGTGKQSTDAPLVQQMHAILTSRQAGSRTAAARVVLQGRQGNIESDVRRLLKRYGETF
jgi:hypothetical protein